MTLKWRTLVAVALAELLAMSLWFSASAVTPSLIVEWRLSSGEAAWLTMTVQLGFVLGALLSALFNLSDLWPPRRVLAGGALLGALLNVSIPLLSVGFPLALALRFATGMSLAAVYPVGMKILATWMKEDRGLGLGILVGALTIGSALPHLLRGLGGGADWQVVLYLVSALAAFGAVTGWWFGDLGPYRAPTPRFRWAYLGEGLRDRSLRLANLGYLGHMWELYAMWTWIPVFLASAYGSASATGDADPVRRAALVTFFVIAIGGPGSVMAGHLADRWGRTRTTMVSLLVSGACALVIGLALPLGPVPVTALALIWGTAVVADSAQFSAAVSELGAREYTGTLLTAQTSAGFLLTLVSIRVIPAMVDRVGWEWAFATLAIGPAVGIWAMWQLNRSPEAARLAGGKG